MTRTACTTGCGRTHPEGILHTGWMVDHATPLGGIICPACVDDATIAANWTVQNLRESAAECGVVFHPERMGAPDWFFETHPDAHEVRNAA